MTSSSEPPSSSLREAVDGFLRQAERGGAGKQAVELPPAVARRIGEGSVLGDFELVRRLGEGGMGVVFEARQSSVSGRRVALKVMHDPLGSPEGRLRFRREIAAIARLDHPSIVTVLDADIEEGTPYFAMKYLGGVSLSRLIDTLRAEHRFPCSSKRLSELTGGTVDESFVRWAARLVARLADALQHAHDRGVIHRDVKPSNIVLNDEGTPALVDFGLASMDTDASQVRTEGFLGTIAYAAPEQLRGEAGDERADIYSLAATLYELVCLIRPYSGRTRTDLVSKITASEPPTMPEHVPRDLRMICCHALGRDPGDRYATAAALAADLREFLAGRPISVRKPSLVTTTVRAARKHPTLTSVLAVLVIAGLLHVRDRRARAQDWVERGQASLAGALVQRGQLETLRQEYGEASRRLDESTPQMDGPGPDPRKIQEAAASIRTLRRSVEEAYAQAETDLLSALSSWGELPSARETLALLYEEELTSALISYEDILHPDRVDSLEARLALYAETDHQRALLDATGNLSVRTRPGGATFQLFTADAWAESGMAIRTGRTGSGDATPLLLEGLDEGSYIFLFRRDGSTPTTYPVFVRRASAAGLGSDGPQAGIVVELLPESELEPDYTWIPGGWTLLEDSPVRWAKVPSFQIQTLEVSFQDWLDWMNRDDPGDGMVPLRDPENASLKPKAPGGDLWFVKLDDDRTWTTTRGTDPRWPVRGIGIHDASTYARTRAGANRSTSDGWYHSLPTRAEWVRAARGADSRAFPWLGSFSWESCAGYYSRGVEDYEPMPYPRGSFENDVSVFGVRDMAGSVREFTKELLGPIRDIYAACGGSYRSPDGEDMQVARLHGVSPTPQYDVGVRIVRRQLPAAWTATPPTAPFRDSFDRPDAVVVGNGWIEVGTALGSPNKRRGERVTLRGGALVCQGDVGNDSLPGVALHKIPRFQGGFVVRVLFRAGWKRGGSGGAFRLELSHGALGAGPLSGIAAKVDGSVTLQVHGEASSQSVDVTDLFALGFDEGCLLEFGFGEGHVELRVLSPTRDRAATGSRSLTLPEDFRAPPYVGFVGSQLNGGWIAIEELEVFAVGVEATDEG